MIGKVLIYLFMGMTLLMNTTFAQQAKEASVDSVLDLSLEQLMNVRIVSASKFEQSIREAPSTISVVSSDQFNKFGWISLNDVLSKQPGFAITQDYERQTLSSRGVFESWNSNHLLLLVDGVPINDQLGGTAITNEVTPLIFSKSIEIIRGPGSALYGSNATNGVINLRTLSASDLKNKVRLRYRKGSWNTNLIDIIVGEENENFSFVSAFNYFATNGFSYESLDASNSSKFNIDNSKSSNYLFNKIEGKGQFAGWSIQHHEQSMGFSTGHGWLSYVPDIPENMKERKRLFILSYRTPDVTKKVQHEYVAKYTQHSEDYFQRFYPNGSVYALGLTEIVKTSFEDYFARTQWSIKLKSNAIILGGIEYSFFNYIGDEAHLSNAKLDSDYSPTPNNEIVSVGKYLPWYDKGYNSSGIYTQYSGNVISKLNLTLGMRYDMAWFSYQDIGNGNAPSSLSLSKLNPRISLVYNPNDRFTIKAMAGNAFRTPSPFELFVGNSFNGITNPKDLKPETVTTYEISTDYLFGKTISWRTNIFHTELSNVIAYGGANNVLINLLSTTTQGLESEWIYKSKTIDAFINYSFTVRVNEGASYPSVSLHKNSITWYPSHLVNAGLAYQGKRWGSSIQAHYQGRVNRKDSDRSTEYDQLRGEYVDAWVTADAKVNFKLSPYITLGLQINNISDSHGKLFKSYLNPFDFQITGRRLMLDLFFQF